MLFSMTGFGDARIQLPDCGITVEARSVNNRHLKVTVRGTDPYPLLESDLEKIVRRWIRRGTLLLQIRVERATRHAEARLNTDLLRH